MVKVQGWKCEIWGIANLRLNNELDGSATRMIALGYILLVVGVIIGIVGEVMFLVVAYKRSLLWFFGCLFIPIVCYDFLFFEYESHHQAIRASSARPAVGRCGLLFGWCRLA